MDSNDKLTAFLCLNAELLRNYLKQIREETSGRLLNCAYRANGFPNKWWLAFAKRKFMNIVIL
jgi:actin related protein 2/3 complex subunit 3